MIMRKITTIGLVLVFIISCKQTPKKFERTDKNTDFYIFYNKLNDLELPVISKCGSGNYSITDFNVFTSDELIKYRPEDYYIFGKINYKDFNSILYGFPGDNLMPMLIVFKNGFPTDTLNLYTTDCGSDLENKVTSNCTIDRNLNIIIQDTLIKYHIDETDAIIDHLTDTTIILKKYKLIEKGKFVEY